MLRFFVKTFADHQKYSRLNRDNLKQPVQTQLSQKKKKKFCQFFSAFLKFRLNFKYFPKKDDLHSSFISEITDSKRRG